MTDADAPTTQRMRGANEWAARLAELMSPDEFCDFVKFFDTCDDLELWDAVTAIDAERHPEEYTGDYCLDGELRTLADVSEPDACSVGSELELNPNQDGDAANANH